MANTERKRRQRLKKREAAHLRSTIAMHERAGDEATTCHLYADATRFYKKALNAPGISPADRERLAEKIGRSSFLSGNLRAANAWFERLLAMNHADGESADRSVQALFHMYRQSLFACQGETGVTIMARALEIARASGDAHLIRLTQLRMAEALQLLCRYEDANRVLREVGAIAKDEKITIQGHYHLTSAIAAGVIGEARTAFEHFEAALAIAKRTLDPDRLTTVWTCYGLTARVLGDTARSKACYEQALVVARQYGISWQIALFSLFYTQTLSHLGQFNAAHPYLLDALSLDPFVPYVDMYRAYLGLPLALEVQDETAVAQCADPRFIRYAMQSQRADMIGGVASSFARLYVAQGRHRAAKSLLHRALQQVRSAHINYDFLLAVGQYGAPADIRVARVILEERLALPHAEVFRATLYLFDAFVEKRRETLPQARVLAREAAARFEALEWHGYVEIARSIVPDLNTNSRNNHSDAPFSSLQPALTNRERQVASLVLRGYTNREIADELHIALHTVEKHMNSIMHRLGVRSRYQVADRLQESRENKSSLP